MTSLAERLRSHINAGGSATSEDLGQVVTEARHLVEAYVGEYVTRIPEAIYERAILECASELWAKRNAIGGVMSDFSDAPPVRLARDPMIAARPLLSPYIPVVFA